nr:hypothetical protein [uncultured Methanobrevibacter sp.]
MVSQDKLIKKGIYLTDNVFDEILKRLSKGIRASDTLEAFITRTKDYTMNNPLVVNGFKDDLLDIILCETNNHKFSRPAQKELVRLTIENRVGDLIVDVGDDIRNSVRDIVKHGYNNNLSQDEIAENITHRIRVIKNTRARTIARTEIARTATASDYVINKERGANAFTVDCRNTACEVCKRKVLTNEQHYIDNISSDKGITGDVEFHIDDVENLPPFHPNCYDKETKVFTNHGWKYFYDITEDDKILSLNPETNETEFLDYVKVIKVPNVHGYLHHIHNKWFDACVTPDHDCFIHQRRDGGNRGRYFEPQFRKPSDLTSESRFVRCIDTDRENPSKININGLELDPKDYAFFMAWFLSEGSVLHNPETAKQHRYPIKITQEIESNRELIQPVLERICESIGLKLAIGKSYFEFYSKEFYDYLEPLGYSHEKYIPFEVFTLDKECLNIFLDNYVLGDGHERKPNKYNSVERSVFTSSPRLRDGLSYIVLLCGYYPSIYVHTPKGKVTKHGNGEFKQNHDVYRISINNSNYTTFRTCTVDIVEYTDEVYCVELPKWHTLWIMRDGKVSWNGNCRCVAMFFKKEGAENHTQNIKGSKIKNKIKEKLGIETKEYAHLKTPEELAKHYNLTYDDGSVSHHIFIDEKNDCTIKIDKNLTDGKKPVIDSTNSSKGEIDLGRIIKSYAETPEPMKIATNNIEFLNEESPTEGDNKDALASHELEGNDSNIYVFSKSAVYGRIEDGESIERQLLHEMSHAIDLNPVHGLHLSDPENNKCKHKRRWGSKCSDYAFTERKENIRKEAIAEAMSMVAYKNRQDKSTAIIKVPTFDENKKYIGNEVIGYDEWHERFNDLAIWLEKELGL